MNNQLEYQKVKLFKLAEVSNLNPDEKAAYEASLKIARDNYSHDETVRKVVELKGRLDEKREIALNLSSKALILRRLPN